MKRRAIIKFTQIHVSIPVRVLEDLDDTLDYNQSRSRIISKMIENYLEGDQINIGSMTKKQIVINLMNQVDSNTAEYVMLQTLLQMSSLRISLSTFTMGLSIVSHLFAKFLRHTCDICLSFTPT